MERYSTDWRKASGDLKQSDENWEIEFQVLVPGLNFSSGRSNLRSHEIVFDEKWHQAVGKRLQSDEQS
jgi:hypothetical protein